MPEANEPRPKPSVVATTLANQSTTGYPMWKNPISKRTRMNITFSGITFEELEELLTRGEEKPDGGEK